MMLCRRTSRVPSYPSAGSNLIYAFATIRKAVKEGGKKAVKEGGKKVYFPELIGLPDPNADVFTASADFLQLAAGSSSNAKERFSDVASSAKYNVGKIFRRYLPKEVAIRDFTEFVKYNRDFIESIDDINTSDDKKPDYLYKLLDLLNQLDVGVVEFDDEFPESELVYAIAYNRYVLLPSEYKLYVTHVFLTG
jgi:hypothetical protein